MDYYIFHLINSLVGYSQILDIIGIIAAEVLICLMPIAVLVIYLFSSQKQKNIFRKNFLKIILIIISAWLINFLIGLIFLRPRPYITHPNTHLLIYGVFYPSFPSSHTALAFAMAFAIMLVNKTAGWIFIVLAFLIGLSRIFVGVHYPLDILGGAAVAGLSTWLINKLVV